jgi:hypothetical protein
MAQQGGIADLIRQYAQPGGSAIGGMLGNQGLGSGIGGIASQLGGIGGQQQPGQFGGGMSGYPSVQGAGQQTLH